jgi:hypothetical protein
MIYQLNYGVEYLGLGKVMWYQQKVSTQIARAPRTYVVHAAENKEVPDRNIGVPPVRKYANYRTLKFYHGHENALIFEMALPEMKQKLLSSVPLVLTVKP